MEYSSTKKVRLPGISTLLIDHDSDDDDDHSHDRRDHREEITPHKTAYNTAQFQTPPTHIGANSSHRRPSTGRKLKRSTLSPSSNQIIHATAEALAAHPVEGATIGQVIIDKLDDFGESVWNRWSALGGRSSRGASVTGDGIQQDDAEDDDYDDDDDNQDESGSTVRHNAGDDGTDDNQHFTLGNNVDDSVAHSLNNSHAPSPNIIASPSLPHEEEEEIEQQQQQQQQQYASPNTTQSTEESFYIGFGEEGFCPSMSIHESDISESGSDEEQLEESILTEDAEEDEEEDGAEGVDSSIFTQHVEEESPGHTARRASEEKRVLEDSNWEDEKKEDSNQKASTDGMTVTNHLETEDPSNESHNRASAIPSPLSGCRIAPSPLTPVPRQQAERDDNSLDSKDFVSSSLKNYLTLQEDKLSSLLSSIAGLTATPARIESAVQDEFSKEEDLDSMISVTGLMTPLRSRLERVELSDCDESGEDGYRGGMLRHSPPEFGRMKAWSEIDSSKEKSKWKLQEVGTEHRGGMLLHSPQGLLHVATSSLTASGLEKASNEFDSSKVKSKWKLQEEAEHRGGMLLHSPPGLLQDAASSLTASGLQTVSNEYDSSTMKSSSKLMQEEAEYTGGMLRHLPPSHAAPSLTFADLENAGSSSATDRKFKEKTPNGAPQSPLLNQNDNIDPKDDLKTPSVDTSASSIASALDIAAAEFSTKSTELMEYLQKAMTTERTTKSTKSCIDISKTSHGVTKHQRHLGQSGPTSSPTALSPFVNLRPQVSKESKIPSEDLDGIPASLREMFENAESILEKELASPVLKGAITRTALADIDTFCEDYIKPPSDSKPVEGSPTECGVIDTDTLEGTDIILDSLKGAFLKAESQLESAASSIVQRINPHENDSIEDDGEDDTTFDTANFSLGALAAAADDFFDSRESPNVVEINGDKVATQDAVCTMEVNSSFVEMDIDSSNPMFEHKQASAECKADVDVPMLTDDLSRTQLTDGDHGSDKEKKKAEESQFVTRGLRPQLSDSGSHTAASIADENVDITLTLARVGDYLKRMTMADHQSISNCEEGFSMDASTDGYTLKTIEVPRFKTSIDFPSILGATSFLPDENILQDSFSTVNAVDERLTQNDAITPRACNVLTLESSIVDYMDESIDSPKDLMSAATVKTGSPAKKINETTPSECSAANLESSKGSEDVDESMFMPNVSMEVMTATSPIPAAAERPLQAMSEEDDDSGALSDEEFFPNRDLSRKSTSKVAASCSVEEKSIPSAVKNVVDVSTRACSLSLGRNDRNVTRREHSSKANNVTNLPPKSSRLSHPVASTSSRRSIPMSKSSPRSTNSSQSHEQKSNSPAQHHPKVSAPTAAFRLRQTNRTAVPPTSPPSNVKPARKRTKLSTITNTSTADSVKETAKTATKTAKISPKTVETVSSVSKATSATDKKIMSHAATKEVDVPRKAASASLTKHTVSVNTRKETNHVVISPRTSSMRRSLVAVAKSQRQSKIPKLKPSPRDSVPPSERLAQLAKPRSVVQKENPPSPKKVTRKKFAAAKPPTLLSRESKKSKVKSTEEIEAEQMSTIQPFEANKIQVSSLEVKSRFNTPRAATPNQTSTDESNPKPFISLKEAIDKYNFREPAAVATPINTKKLRDSTPSFLEREMSKPPKQNVPTLAESIKSYDFRATVASTPTNPKTRPPSFLNRPVAVHLPKSSEELELEECKNKFKACPIPISSTSKLRPPSRPREGRTLTTPRPPKLHTSMRSGQLKTPVPSEDDIELSKQFHARPLPVSLYGSRFATSTPIRHYERTPQPSTDEVELSKQFHALPLPTEIYGTTIENDGTPFHIRAEQQYERAQERRRKLFEDEMEELRRSRERKATPLPKTNWEAKPILIEKSNVELVQPRPPRLSLDVRSRSRRQFDEYVHQVREADAAAKEAKLAAEAEAEEAEIRRKRALSIEEGGFCFRARPISIKYE